MKRVISIEAIMFVAICMIPFAIIIYYDFFKEIFKNHNKKDESNIMEAEKADKKDE